MTEDEKRDLAEAFDRVTVAVAGKPDDGLVEFRCGDVAALGAFIADADHHPKTRDVYLGAKRCMDEEGPEKPAFQTAGLLRRLLAKVQLPK